MNTRAVLFSIASGVIFGAAWRGSIPSFFGVLGLGLFFVQQRTLVSSHWLKRGSLAWLTGFTAFAIACSWVFDTAEYLLETDSGMILFPVGFAVWSIHAAPFVFFALLLRHAGRWTQSLLVMPPLWLLCEWLSPSLFPFPIGCLLLDLPWLAQPAEIGGVTLLSLLAACYALAVPGAIHLWMQWKAEPKSRSVFRNASEQKSAASKKGKKSSRKNRRPEKPTAKTVAFHTRLRVHWRELALTGALVLTIVWARSGWNTLNRATVRASHSMF